VNQYLAVPMPLEAKARGLYLLSNPPKTGYILDRMVEHENWWSEFQKGRREAAAGLVTDPANVIFEVWHEADIVGLVLLTHIVPQVDARLHFIFFDGKLNNLLGKTRLLRAVMAWAFDRIPLYRMSAETPEYEHALIDYARRKLGFRFEAENRSIWIRTTVPGRRKKTSVERQPTLYQAACGSRKYRVVRYKGEWHDLILLSVTREEFGAFLTQGAHDGVATGGRNGDRGGDVPARDRDGSGQSTASLPE